MQRRDSEKILVALDQSEPSLEAVKYIAGVPAFRDHQVSLLHIFTEVGAHYYALGNHPAYSKRVSDVKVWELQTKSRAERFLADAKGLLVSAGFPDSAVKTVIQGLDAGIASDIMKEARKGYMAVALGRKSMSPLRNIVMGSVASKLVERLAEVPLFLVGKAVNTKRVLIAFDGSENAVRLVDFVGHTLSKHCKATLLHVIRGSESDHVEEAETFISPLLEQARDRLVECGMPSDHVAVSLIKGAASRAGTILSEAKSHRHGTIVVGTLKNPSAWPRA